MIMLVLVQLKNIYANACSLGSKQEELEAVLGQGTYNVVVTTDMWWNESPNCSVRRDTQSRRDGNMVLHVREYFDCIEIDDDEDDNVQCLWVKTGEGQQGRHRGGNLLQTTSKDEQAHQAFYKWLAEVSCSPALVLVGDFNLPDVCWK